MMEEQSLMPLTQFLPSLPLSSCSGTITATTNCFLFPDTPPLTPAINGLASSTSTCAYNHSTANSQSHFSSSAFITPRTPRKPAHPCCFALSSINKDKSAIISFKMVQDSGRSPSLRITSSTPCRSHRLTGARRRLWVPAGEISERFTLEDSECTSSKVEFKEALPPKSAGLYGDPIEADDEMDGNSASSSLSPPYSPGCSENTSEAVTNKPSSSSYLHPRPHPHHSQHFFLQTTIKEKRGYSPKIKPIHKSKTCASCKTKKTPLWRDSEDGISYCNACGIRFKKYRVRCSNCQYIPRKDEREMSKQCCHCGAQLMHCKLYGR